MHAWLQLVVLESTEVEVLLLVQQILDACRGLHVTGGGKRQLLRVHARVCQTVASRPEVHVVVRLAGIY